MFDLENTVAVIIEIVAWFLVLQFSVFSSLSPPVNNTFPQGGMTCYSFCLQLFPLWVIPPIPPPMGWPCLQVSLAVFRVSGYMSNSLLSMALFRPSKYFMFEPSPASSKFFSPSYIPSLSSPNLYAPVQRTRSVIHPAFSLVSSPLPIYHEIQLLLCLLNGL